MQHSSAQNRGSRKPKRRSSRKKKHTQFFVFIVLLLLLFVAALLLGNKPVQKPASSTVSTSTPVKSTITSTPIPAAQPPIETKPVIVGKYDVEGIPPLFNATHFIPDSYQLDLSGIGNGHTMQAPASVAFNDMVAAAKADGVDILPISGYRSHRYQTQIYENKIQLYLNQGLSKQEATRRTQEYHAIPGTSEHEAGLAVDVNSLEDSFDQTDEFQWLQQHAAEYGFIFRYRKNTIDITGIAYEPWHYRFVGTNHAKKIQELGNITLEEYVEKLENE